MFLRMSFAAFLWLMGGTSLVALGGWLYVLAFVDPLESGWLGLVLFYVTLYAACIGIFSMIGLLFRVQFRGRHDVMSREVKIAVRHAVMFATVFVVSLALSAKNLLTWWNLAALFAVVGLIEYAFLLVQESRRQ